MLYKETVTGTTLELLKRLMADPGLAQFALVGGTNLSLRLGHRKSIDLDLFTNSSFDAQLLAARLPVVIRMASLPDVAAMKLSAVARRGVKKDFWDIATLLHHFSLDEMLGFYRTNYSSHDIFHLLRSLVYFIDAEAQKDPAPLNEVTWKQVKKKIEASVQRYIDFNLR